MESAWPTNRHRRDTILNPMDPDSRIGFYSVNLKTGQTNWFENGQAQCKEAMALAVLETIHSYHLAKYTIISQSTKQDHSHTFGHHTQTPPPAQ